MSTYVALDFETADYKRDSACAIGMVAVSDGRIVDRYYQLIRPPRQAFVFTYIHGITWEHVKNEPTFKAVWKNISAYLTEADYVLAHNASFDRSVLKACCIASEIEVPPIQFVCTVKLARQVWDINPTKLPDVCRKLNIDFKNHHNAEADALACARIGLTAIDGGHSLEHGRLY
jgi:DNA polymerase-3 subunit epsilon